MRASLPHSAKGQVIGLLGGSFDPPHVGHVHISREALKRFALDQVWWLVSPGNPLKQNGPAPMERRMDAAKCLVNHPRIHISDYEAQIGTRYTAQTLMHLRHEAPDARFVWLMGADNMAQFHRWENWRWIIEEFDIGILARPRDRVHARMSKAARIYAHSRLRGRESRLLGGFNRPKWCMVNVPMLDVSSSEIRARGDW